MKENICLEDPRGAAAVHDKSKLKSANTLVNGVRKVGTILLFFSSDKGSCGSCWAFASSTATVEISCCSEHWFAVRIVRTTDGDTMCASNPDASGGDGGLWPGCCDW